MLVYIVVDVKASAVETQGRADNPEAKRNVRIDETDCSMIAVRWGVILWES